MRKKLLFAIAFVALAAAFTACEKNCKTCQQNTYVNGVLETQNGAQEYCGAALAVVEATGDVTIGNTTTKWECD